MAARPVLTRFEQVIFKSKSAADPTQVPFPYAQVDFYLQGATVSQDISIPGSGSQQVTVAVRDPGALRPGMSVQAGPGVSCLSALQVPEKRCWPVPLAGSLSFLWWSFGFLH